MSDWDELGDVARDSAVFTAAEAWWKDRSDELRLSGCDVTLLGPFDGPTADPVYVVEFRAADTDACVCLSRGGVAEWSLLDPSAAGSDVGRVQLSSADDLAATFDSLVSGCTSRQRPPASLPPGT